MDQALKFLQEHNQRVYTRDDISIITVDDISGVSLTAQMLTQIVDRKTVLFLSGGRTPKDLYIQLAKEQNITPGAIGLIDERYGVSLQANSNESMIHETGLISHAEAQNIRFYPILKKDTDRRNTALQYDQTIRSLFSSFPKTVGILGIGLDGHTAGIPAGVKSSELKVQSELCVDIDNFPGPFKERVTMTFLALSMLDILAVIVFGEDKKDALEKMLSNGSEEEIPSRFFRRSDIAKKTLLITDQKM